MHATACLAAKNNCLAAKIKCLAGSNRTRTSTKPTNNRSAPSAPPLVQMGPRQASAPLTRPHFGQPERKPTWCSPADRR
jgi:hypothetical protein